MRKNKRKSNNVDTLIADGTCINGDMSFAGALFVDGEINGEVKGDTEKQSVLSIGVHGKIKGNISTPYAIIFGQVDGDVYVTEKIDLKPGAKINGDLYYKVIEMNAGAEVNGKMVVVGDPKALEHKAEDAQSSNSAIQEDSSHQESVEAEPVKA
ncbi:polymer-forming cytoskeletal protein [Kangiella sp. HD9-110m-PIT-SAG06]|nr:polymer-forming cytoskeletal protein [Kangiella sp. HD9-110m-PIT-SAG06]RDX36771.1 polymer-forming cytoskeletal protein [Kangiella sp. HD9-110m-PIT-SAG07]